MQISRGNYIRQALDDPALAEAFGAEWDEMEASWQASLPAATDAVRGYLATLGLRREEYDPEQHGTREEVEAAAAAWEAEQQAAAAEAERLSEAAAREEARAKETQEAREAEARQREQEEKEALTAALDALEVEPTAEAVAKVLLLQHGRKLTKPDSNK